MKWILNSAVIVCLLVSVTGCQEEEFSGELNNRLLLKFNDTAIYLADFKEYITYFWPQETTPLPKLTVQQYLNDFIDHSLLLDHAMKLAPEDAGSPQTVAQEIVLIQEMLQGKVMQEVDDYEARLRQMFEEFYTEERVEINSVYYADEITARNELKRLRSNPERFDQAMLENNPEGMMQEELGQGIYSASQLPEEWRESIFETEEPGIVGPIEIPNGYIVVKIIQFLGKPSFEEKRQEIEHVFMTQERNRARQQLLASLRQKLQLEYYPERVLDSPFFVEELTE